MIKSILITGANNGIGKETARQFAMLNGTEKIYLACRNEEKAKHAKQSLEQSTGKSIFKIVLMDVSNIDSVRSAVKSLTEPIEAIVMNAGGMGGKNPAQKTSDGVSQIFATNVLGHVVLFDEMVKANLLTKVALFAGTEASRGVPKMGMNRPNLKTSSIDEFSSICDSSYFGNEFDPMQAYGLVKYVATMWMSSEARKNPNLRIVTISPGGTKGTAVMDDLPFFSKIMYKYLMMPILMPLMGMVHKLELGAKRFIDGIIDESYKSGVFYGSKEPVLTGSVIDQSTIFADLKNNTFQDNANMAIHKFIKD
ncbi:MAG: SDR family NAD(P)-dependent oxidoreductase [Bacteroidales bacterium]|nr:SDR family NAD(P)-dependent oxidoreductase [Bacteroidales bacterium]